MVRGRRGTYVVAALLGLALAACDAGGGGTKVAPGGGGGSADGGSGGSGGGDGGSGGTGGEPARGITAEDAFGAWVLGSVEATLPGRAGPRDLFGYVPLLALPEELGLDAPVDEDGVAFVGSGLAVLDRTTGRARVYTSADGLPETIYSLDSFVPRTYAPHTVPITSLAWVEADRVFAAAGLDYLIVGRFDDSGAVTFSSRTLPVGGNPENAVFMDRVAASGGTIWAGTRMGLVEVDPALLGEPRWVDMGVPVEEAYVHAMAVAELDGPRVAALVGDQWGPFHLVVAGGATPRVLDLPAGQALLSLAAAPGLLLVGASGADGGRVYALRAGAAGLEEWLPAARLAGPTAGNVLPRALAYDAGRRQLLVGGDGQTLLTFAFDEAAGTAGPGAEVLDRRDARRLALPRSIDAIELDALGHWYVGGSAYEGRRANQLPSRWEFGADGDPRVVRPFVSGVRDLAPDPGGGGVWLGIGDEANTLLAANGGVANAICRLRDDGACELYTPRINTDNTAKFDPTVAGRAIAFGDPARREAVVVTTSGSVLLRTGDASRVVDVTRNPWVNSQIHSWSVGDGALWLGTLGYREAGDSPELARRSPQGLGLVEYGAEGAPTFYRRYVREAGLRPGEETANHEVEGMPSNQVWAHQVLAGPRHVLAALGIERHRVEVDHDLGEPDPGGARGAIVELEDETVTVYPPPAGIAFGDVVALARRPDGSFLALDAAVGLVAVDVASRTTTLWADAPWTSPERGLSLAVDGLGHVAVGTTRGLWLWDALGTVTSAHDGAAGYVWTVRFVADGVLYAGTDHGLLRLALDGAALPPLGSAGPLPTEPWPLSPGCYGEDGCVCLVQADCAPELACRCLEGDCSCLDHDPCLDHPGFSGCGCARHDDCVAPRTCEIWQGQSRCFACGGVQGCSCTDAVPCAGGFACGAGGTCERSACADDCSCATPTGCPGEELCDVGAEVPTCRPGYPACAYSCSCATDGGCPPGLHCGENTCLRDQP